MIQSIIYITCIIVEAIFFFFFFTFTHYWFWQQPQPLNPCYMIQNDLFKLPETVWHHKKKNLRTENGSFMNYLQIIKSNSALNWCKAQKSSSNMSVNWTSLGCQQRFIAFLILITSVSGTIISTIHTNHQNWQK